MAHQFQPRSSISSSDMTILFYLPGVLLDATSQAESPITMFKFQVKHEDIMQFTILSIVREVDL